MYIDTTSVGAVDRRFENVIVRLIRAAMNPFEAEVERIQVSMSSRSEAHVCRLHAWARRGRTVVIESSASSRLGAIEAATDHLKQTLASRPPRGPGASSGARSLVASAPDSSRGLASSPAEVPSGDVRSGIFARQTARERRRVLLVLRELDPSSACLQWARLLAGVLGPDLDVCRVLPGAAATDDGLAPGKAWLEATRRVLAATRETRRWCATVLPEAELPERLILGTSRIVEEAALLARERGVDWIVMPDVLPGCGPLATALARASGRPVLVARSPTSRSTLLVASDLSDDVHPIASRTAALAEALHAPVLAFHDVGFGPVDSRAIDAGGLDGPERSSRLNALTQAWAELQNERLESGCHQRLPELEVLLARGTDRVETILQQARREDAEIIVVGACADAAGSGAELASHVIERAVRSVLVVPPDMSPAPSRQSHPEHEERDARRPSAPAGLGRRGWPRAGARARHPSDGRRWRSG